MNQELPDVQVGFRTGREQIANIRWITEKASAFQKCIYFCFIDYTKAFNCVDHNKLGKILKEMGIPDHLACLLRNQLQLEPDTEQQTGSKLGKEYIKVIYCHPVYLTSMLSISCIMLGWITSGIKNWNQDCQEKYQQPHIYR